MPRYTFPRIYVEETSSISRSIEGVETSIAAFIGKTRKGPVGKVKLIRSFTDYKYIYGNIVSENDAMGLAVHSYFLNGGQTAYICRLASKHSKLAKANHYRDFYENTLQFIRDVSIILTPGEYWAKDGSGNPIISTTIAHCEKMKNRMAIIDPPPGLRLSQPWVVNKLSLPSSSYSVLYYPWVKVTNPFYHAETNPTANKTLDVAPSSFAAGVWSRTDAKRGIWKAPAGTGTQLTDIVGLDYLVEDSEQSQIYPLGVNCIRKMSMGNYAIWGARTLTSDPKLCYVPVQRLAIYIKESIYNGIQWAVFEPNDYRLWTTLRGTISNFMLSLFRNGAFQGNKSSDTYFVRCGLGDTMTQADIDTGLIIIMIGFVPIKPADFVIIRIRLKVNQQ